MRSESVTIKEHEQQQHAMQDAAAPAAVQQKVCALQDIFEVGRRYKIMNPDKMRSEYGKLVYLLIDAADPNIKQLLEFNAVRPLKTVYSLLEEKGGLAMLSDPLMSRATREIVSLGRSRYDIQKDIKDKERSRDTLAHRSAMSRSTRLKK